MVEGFHDVQFPTEISRGAICTSSRWETMIVEDAAHYESRNANWADSRAKYEVTHGLKTKTQMDALVAFHRCRRGRLYSFRFKDWTDFELTNELAVLVSGTDDEYQIYKTYSDSEDSYARKITKPVLTVPSSLVVKVGGVTKTEGVGNDFTVDYDTGIITFAVAPGASAVTVSGQFDVHVRFDTDECPVSIEYFENRNWEAIELVEVPE